MKYTLIKYKGIKLLINEGLNSKSLIRNLDKVEALSERVTKFYENLMTASKEEGQELEKDRAKLISEIGYKIIGVPFTNNDAELYALDKGLDYEVLELVEPLSKLTIEVPRAKKSKWVAQANKDGMKLIPWVIKRLDDEQE